MRQLTAAALGVTLIIAACDAPEEADPITPRSALAAPALASAEAADVRRVWADAGDYATPSPDGRFATFVDWTTGDVAMRDLQTGEETRLTDKGSWPENGSWAEEPLFSPDGKQVAYAYGNAQRPEGEQWRYELRMVEVGDTEQHVIHAITPEDEWIGPMDWSAAHGIVAEINRGDGSTDLVLVDPESGEMKTLATYGAEETHPHAAFFSPGDGRLAFRRDDDVYVRDLAGGEESRLELPVKQLLGWTPDGSAVLVHTSHRGETGIWALPLEGVHLAGEPLLVRAGLPAVAAGGRAGDRYFYGVPVDAPKLHQASIDPATGRVLAEPTALTSPLDGRASHPVWSPDGKSLVYTLEKFLDRELRFMVRATESDAVREIARGDFRAGAIQNVRWAEDGESLLFLSVTDGRSPAFYRVDPRTGGITQETKRGAGQSFDVMPDGERVLVAETDPPETRTGGVLVVRDLDTGARDTVTVLPADRNIGGVDVAPDGRRAAFVHRDPATETTAVSLVDLASGEVRDLHTLEGRVHIENQPWALAWSADSRHILVIRGAWEKDESHVILSVPVDGGEPRVLLSAEGRKYLAVHPDGRRLALSGGEMRAELWVLDGVSEALEAARMASK